jgi:flagellar biosynthesis protein FliQ
LGSSKTLVITEYAVYKLLVIAGSVVFLSIATGIVLALRKAKRQGEKIWDKSSQRLIINFLIPLVTGGILILYLIEKEPFSLIATLTLVFYGLTCINASKYTLGDIRYLGITLLLLAFISLWFIGHGL